MKKDRKIFYIAVSCQCMSFAVMFFKKSNGKFSFATLTE